jgi:hypothetical protein
MLPNNEAVIFNYGSYSHPDFSLTQAAENLKPMKANRPDASYQVKSLYVEYFKGPRFRDWSSGPLALRVRRATSSTDGSKSTPQDTCHQPRPGQT